jgi:hypothetical protein
MSEKTQEPDVKVPLATFNDRLIAGVIDYGIFYGLIIVGVILQLVIQIWIYWLGALLGWLFYIASIAAAFYIFVWMPYKQNGQTFGKKNRNIKIMLIEDEAKWTVRPVGDGDLVPLLIRAIIGGIEAAFLVPIVIPWYFITNDNNRQRLADQLAKTVVVQTDETGEVLKKPREK